MPKHGRKNDPSLGIAYPKDYVLVLSRVSFISQESEHPNAAKLWLDYVLSEKGQQILASQADIPSIRRDIEGKNDIDGMTALLGQSVKTDPGQRNAAGLFTAAKTSAVY
ncbi:ABC transporter, periplasmmic iron binding protein [Klebsiella variicola]|nr:ABC transporter, periplasmmic iron binding protein [Klebsiella variicola]